MKYDNFEMQSYTKHELKEGELFKIEKDYVKFLNSQEIEKHGEKTLYQENYVYMNDEEFIKFCNITKEKNIGFNTSRLENLMEKYSVAIMNTFLCIGMGSDFQDYDFINDNEKNIQKAIIKSGTATIKALYDVEEFVTQCCSGSVIIKFCIEHQDSGRVLLVFGTDMLEAMKNMEKEIIEYLDKEENENN